MNTKLKIVFMGTPAFATGVLKAMVEANLNVVGVVTAPDKPAGRGLKLMPSDVKQYAVQQGLHILQPEKLKAPDFLEQLRALEADLFIVVAFRMLPEVVWTMPPKGTINLHASLLPQYRGAAPIHWAIINGETQSGVTTFFIEHQIDTGNLIFQEKMNISADETTGHLHDRMMETGAKLMIKTIEAVAAGTAPSVPQYMPADGVLHHAPKIFKEHCLIDWNKTVTEVHNLIRGMNPFPIAYTGIKNLQTEETLILKIYESVAHHQVHQYSPGEIMTDGKSFAKIAVSDGFIELKLIQLQGRKAMQISEFLRGFNFTNYVVSSDVL